MSSISRLHTMIIVAIFASITGILAQVSIPLPFNMIPITGQTLAIGLAATILGSKKGTYAIILYCILGAVGVPVFAQFGSGIGSLIGPTGGFIIGFIPTVFIIGLVLEKTTFNVWMGTLANIVGMLVTLSFGTVWYKLLTDVSWQSAFATAFFPFLLVGVLKAYLASIVGITVRNRLISAKLLKMPKSNIA